MSGASPVRSETGFSLVEVLVALAIITTLFIVAATGLVVTVTQSNANKERQTLQVALSSYGESVKQMSYLGTCGTATPAGYTTGYDAWAERWVPSPTGVTVAVTAVSYWEQSSGTFVGGCPVTDSGAQRLTLTATYHGASQTAVVVKRDPDGAP